MQITFRVLSFLVFGCAVLISPLLAEQNRELGSAGHSVLADAPSPAWEVGVREELAAREYWVTWQDRTQLEELAAAWHAPNRAQGIRTYFTPRGCHTIPRTEETPSWSWGLSLIAYGRGSNSFPVEPARLFPDENRIRLDRRVVEEWFVNEPRGLKHGFVLHASPDSDPSSQDGQHEIYLDLVVNGSLTPELEAHGESIRFVGPSGLGVIYYRGLEVQDAVGRALPARMELRYEPGVWFIRLLLEDAGAVYPLTIDPVTTTAAWVGEIDQSHSRFGGFVNIAGDVNGDGYDDMIVGAYRYDNGEENEGAAFLYLGSTNGPSETYDWMTEGDEPFAAAGSPVAAAGDVNGDGYDDVAVGVGFDSDKLWVFHGSSAGLSSAPDWVGRSGDSSWGDSVDTAGDVNGDGYDDLLVGAPHASASGLIQNGRVFLYYGSDSGLSTSPQWSASGPQSFAAFGASAGTAGDVNGDGYDDLIVGAYWFDNGETDEGRAFVFHGSEFGVSQEADWIFENNIFRACLGWSVATAGDINGDGYDDVIVGSPQNACWNGPTSAWGKAYAFHGSESGLAIAPNWSGQLVQVGALYGMDVSTVGDVNEDGHDDVLVGARSFDNDEVDEGAAFLYLGSETGLTLEHAWMQEGNQEGARFGYMGTGAGDVNGDDVDDVLVGARLYDNGEEDEGRAYLYLGTGSTAPAGSVPSDAPLELQLLGLSLHLSWEPSCLATDIDYAVYEGQIGDFTSHEPRLCSTGGQTSISFPPTGRATYYLVVPRSRSSEGSYGKDSDGEERPPGNPACLVQAIGDC